MGIAGHRAEESQCSVRLAGKCGEVVGLPCPIEHNPGPIPLGQLLSMEGTQGKLQRHLLTAQLMHQGKKVQPQLSAGQQGSLQPPKEMDPVWRWSMI